MLSSKIKYTFKQLDINFPIDYTSNYLNVLMCDNITNYKNGLKNSLKLYKSFKFDTLLFKVDFLYKKNNDLDLEQSINILNRFINICKLKKPAIMKKYLYNNEDNILTETIAFCWDLSNERIKIKNLIKEILFLNNAGFNELSSSVFFLDTNKHILFNFYDDKIIKILSNDTKNTNKICKKFKNIIIE
ncbi:hypothetical protein [uncultured Tyzzerella sp.]|uniref:DUF3885 domain-containing protein n=1 Tax=uncultured Tyzzerella sp. TaxID=2321398 RepID=UPI002943E945|nr:hypothetical protein [uncultured Tyzzerella sp.]